MSPKHTKTQDPPGHNIPGASKAWMSHFSPSSNGRIIRVRLRETDYLAYAPELLCHLTTWHNLHGGACQHGKSDPRYSKWPCASCHWNYRGGTKDSPRALNNALDNPNRKIAMIPGPRVFDQPWDIGREVRRSWGWALASGQGYDKAKMGKQIECFINDGHKQQEDEGVGEYRKNKRMQIGKSGGKNLKMLRFAHSMPGQDDPVVNGREMAFAGDVLPSDGRWGRLNSGGVQLGTEEEKELADLRKKGLLRDAGADEGVVTLDSVARPDEPVYTVRLVQKKKRGGKGKGKVTDGQELVSATSPSVTSEGEIAADATAQTLDVLSQEVVDAMPDHCWEGFLADMEAEGWVPVVEDDLVSVAESWVVMESGSEDSDEKT